MVTLLDVAAANKIPLTGLEVTIDSKLAVAANESKLSWERKLRISRMIRGIRVTGPLTNEHRALLLRGAEWCPVDNTLTKSVEIETKLLDAD